jgi:magnesium transporter
MPFTKKSQKAGLAPGTLIYIGDQKEENLKTHVINYGPHHCEEKSVPTIKECLSYVTAESVTWINITGVHDVKTIQELGELFGIHALVLEDVVNTTNRPKLDQYDDCVYILLKMLYSEPASHLIKHEQISLILGAGYVISLQEVEGDVFDPIRERLKKGNGRIRTQGSDYLAYALIDTIVDNYFAVLEQIAEKIEDLQDQVIEDPDEDLLGVIQQLKHEMVFVRRSIWPMREIVTALIRDESKLIGENIDLYLRDLYDHTLQVIDSVDSLRDMLSGLMDVYLSSISNRMNQVIKVLTIMATIFIPLTFIAGIYGMNFKHMPELEWKWSYPLLWLLIITIFVGMITWLRRRKWF